MPGNPTTLTSRLDFLPVFQAVPAALLLLDPALNVIDASDRYLAVTGLKRQDVLGHGVIGLFAESHDRHPDDLLATLARTLKSRLPQEATVRRYAGPATLDDHARWNTLTTPVLGPDGRITCLIHCIRDAQGDAVSAPAQAPPAPGPDADADLLAGLPHRFLFEALANRMLAAVSRREELLALLWIRLDGLAAIQETHGLEVRNQVFGMAAWRLAHSLRRADAVGHLEGHCFAACMYGLRHRDNVLPPVNKLLDTLSQPFPWGDHTFTLVPCIGVGFFPEDGTTLEALLAQARDAIEHAGHPGVHGGTSQWAFMRAQPAA